MINLIDVDTVVLGGVYAPLAPWLVPAVEAEVRVRVLTASWAPVTVRPSALGAAAAVVGAAGSVVRGVLDDPARWLQRTPALGRL
jgi:predicted NBD/HSP70 family sugar kinase